MNIHCTMRKFPYDSTWLLYCCVIIVVSHLLICFAALSAEVFTKLARNEIFQIKPATLHFEGLYVGKTQKQTLVYMHINV